MEFRWIEWNIGKVRHHGVTPEEAENVVEEAADPYPQHREDGKDPRKNNLFIWHGCHSERSEESRGNCRGDPSLRSG